MTYTFFEEVCDKIRNCVFDGNGPINEETVQDLIQFISSQ